MQDIKRSETERDWPKYASENLLWDIEQQIFPKEQIRSNKIFECATR